MCFSTEASFAGGIIITAIGVATILKVHKSSQIIFASIPIFFGLQQITEGVIWLALKHPEYSYLLHWSTIIFMVMANVFWPIMIPLAILCMETDKKRRKILWGVLSLGIFLSMYFSLCLLTFEVNPEIRLYHIEYVDNFPSSIHLLAFGIYLITSITPLFISSHKKMFIFGILMTLSCLVTIIFFTQYLTSVWCFFAAIISLLIYWILNDAKRKAKR